MATSQERELPSLTANASLIRWHGYAALACVLYVALLGLAMSIKLHAPDWLGDVSWLTWGRLRYAHTQGVFFGWLGNAFLAFLYYAVPRLAGRPVTSVRLGWALFFVWNGLVVVPGWALVQAGVSQPLEWAEFPLAWTARRRWGWAWRVSSSSFRFLRARVPDLYVSAWYILGGLTFTLLAYPVGNLVPEYLAGARGAAFSGLWIHDAVGLICHAAGPGHRLRRHSRRRAPADLQPLPVDDRLLAVVPDLSAQRHASLYFLVDPDGGTKGGDCRLGLPRGRRILVVTNLLLSLRGRASVAAADAPLRFVWVGVVRT